VRITSTFALFFLVLATSLAFAQDVRIGVLGLFHPRQLTLSAPTASALVVHAAQETFILEKSSGMDLVDIRLSGSSIVLRKGTHIVRGSAVTITGRDNRPVDFQLAVPGKLTRRYRGILELRSTPQFLVAMIRMDIETAVASVVAAESMPGTPPEALKAQAIAARSYFVAGKDRHRGFDFCDTTHCQFLREPPAPDTPAGRASSATRGAVMVYRSQPFAAMYTRSCSGRTRTPADIGLPGAAYPYYSVDCKYCREHPAPWQSRLSVTDAAALRSSDEPARLRIDRRLGWSAVPSNTFVMEKESDHVALHGTGEGHGIGLCQSGARAMAEAGATFHQILDHYYPNTTIMNLDRSVHIR